MPGPRTGIVPLRRSRAEDAVAIRVPNWRAKRAAVGALALAAVLFDAGCGRKGPPLPPLVRVPQPILSLDTRRLGAEVLVSFTVPTQNVDGASPADISRLDLFALTTDRAPDRTEFERLAVRVASIAVSAPPAADTSSATASKTIEPAVAQGERATLRETLEAADLKPVTLPRKEPPVPAAGTETPAQDKAGAATAAAQADQTPAPPGPRRHYMVVAVTDRGRVSRSILTSISVRALPPAPDNLTIEYSKDSLTLSWSAATDAVGYYVYRAAPEAAESADGDGTPAEPPPALNASLEESTSFTEAVVFGEQRCFQVRAVTEVDGERIEGDASAPKCDTPEDTFAPAAPEGLNALTAPDGIALRWTPNAEKDLSGYLVLRGRAGDATLAQIARVPATQAQYVDRDVMSGVRYVYAIVALDSRAPAPNRSEESERNDALAP